MARAKKHSTPKKHPAKRGTAKVPKRTTASVSPIVHSDGPDPIFKLIEDFKASEEEFSKAVSVFGACEKRDGVGVDTVASRAAERNIEKAENAASDALRRVCDTPPQTLSGIIALVRAVRPSHENPDGSLHDYSDGRALNLFATLETALVGLSQ